MPETFIEKRASGRREVMRRAADWLRDTLSAAEIQARDALAYQSYLANDRRSAERRSNMDRRGHMKE